MVSLGVSGSAREAVSTVQAMCLLTVVLAEPFYLRRDHLDQGRSLETEGNNSNVVRDRDDAKVSVHGHRAQCHSSPRRLFAPAYSRAFTTTITSPLPTPFDHTTTSSSSRRHYHHHY